MPVRRAPPPTVSECGCTFPYFVGHGLFKHKVYGCTQGGQSRGMWDGAPWCEYHHSTDDIPSNNEVNGWGYCGDIPTCADDVLTSGVMGDGLGVCSDWAGGWCFDDVLCTAEDVADAAHACSNGEVGGIADYTGVYTKSEVDYVRQNCPLTCGVCAEGETVVDPLLGEPGGDLADTCGVANLAPSGPSSVANCGGCAAIAAAVGQEFTGECKSTQYQDGVSRYWCDSVETTRNPTRPGAQSEPYYWMWCDDVLDDAVQDDVYFYTQDYPGFISGFGCDASVPSKPVYNGANVQPSPCFTIEIGQTAQVPGSCVCHETCATCGYMGDDYVPNNPDDCITCKKPDKDGSYVPVKSDPSFLTGTCPV